MRAISLAGAAFVALLLAASAGADGGPRATALVEAGGWIWATVPNGVVAIDPRTAELRPPPRSLATRTGDVVRIAGADDALWGLRPWTLLRLDVRGREPVRALQIPGPAYALAVDGNTVWTVGYDSGRLVAVDGRTGDVTRSVTRIGRGVEAIASDGVSLWATSIGPARRGRGGALVPLGRGTLTHVDPRSGRILARVAVGRGPGAIAVAAGSIWVANFRGAGPDNTITRVDPVGNRVVATVRLPARPSGLTAHHGALWVLGVHERRGTAMLTRIDPATNAAVTHRVLPRARIPAGILSAGRWLWIADEGRATVLRIDARTGRSTAVVSVRALRAATPPVRDHRAESSDDSARRVPLLAVVACVLAVVTAAALLADAWSRRRDVAAERPSHT